MKDVILKIGTKTYRASAEPTIEHWRLILEYNKAHGNKRLLLDDGPLNGIVETLSKATGAPKEGLEHSKIEDILSAWQAFQDNIIEVFEVLGEKNTDGPQRPEK